MYDRKESDPVGIQTQDLQNRNLTLYSAKLRDQFFILAAKVYIFIIMKEFLASFISKRQNILIFHVILTRLFTFFGFLLHKKTLPLYIGRLNSLSLLQVEQMRH